jgi:hypothetical protein
VYRGPPHAGPAAVCLGRRRLADVPPRPELFPYMALPLEVFEERYLIMMANLLKTVQARFGVVLIERDHQLGAARRCPENDPDAANRPGPQMDRLTDRHGQRIVPGILLTMVGSTVLGTTLLVRGSAPRLPALLLALAIPLAWLILQATSLGNAALPIMFAFGILGRRLASGSAVGDLPAAEAPAR